jgi:hypothetical protein
MATINVYVPAALKVRLSDHPDLNLSELARRAWSDALQRVLLRKALTEQGIGL